MRFTAKVPTGTPLNKLRGPKGQRMKALYKLLAQQHKIGRFRHVYDPAARETQYPVNLAPFSANTCLHGIVHSVLAAHRDDRRHDHPHRARHRSRSRHRRYDLGITVPPAGFHALPITPHAFHSDWIHSLHRSRPGLDAL
ncbi:hypothetical protein ACFWIA_34920 [Streptomyces sp. NPDC127068]|uniref:hypothetical protein n=1 Tax=Streptomyces sp. NPDC127068 TaxID=3347127 RepID=UPI00365B86F6